MDFRGRQIFRLNVSDNRKTSFVNIRITCDAIFGVWIEVKITRGICHSIRMQFVSQVVEGQGHQGLVDQVAPHTHLHVERPADERVDHAGRELLVLLNLALCPGVTNASSVAHCVKIKQREIKCNHG